VNILDRVFNAIGFAPVARGLAQEVISSPWADTDNLTKWTLDDLFGSLDFAGMPVNRKTAMQVATVARARNTLTTTIGRLGLYSAKGSQPAPVQMPLLAQPERGVAFSTTMAWTVDALLFHPCTWWHVTERDTYGWPLWVEWIDRSRATLDVNGDLAKIDNTEVKPADVIRFDSPLGSGFLHDARVTLQRALAINHAAADAEANPVPSIELHHEADVALTPPEIKSLTTAWREARVKSGVAYTPKSITAKALGLVPEQLLIDGRKAIQLELVRHLNFPAWAADVELDGSSLNYTNRASRAAELIDLAMAPYMSAIRDRLSMGDVTPRGWKVLFDTDEFTKDDTATRYANYATALDKGFLTLDEVRAAEGRDPITPTPTEQTK